MSDTKQQHIQQKSGFCKCLFVVGMMYECLSNLRSTIHCKPNTMCSITLKLFPIWCSNQANHCCWWVICLPNASLPPKVFLFVGSHKLFKFTGAQVFVVMIHCPDCTIIHSCIQIILHLRTFSICQENTCILEISCLKNHLLHSYWKSKWGSCHENKDIMGWPMIAWSEKMNQIKKHLSWMQWTRHAFHIVQNVFSNSVTYYIRRLQWNWNQIRMHQQEVNNAFSNNATWSKVMNQRSQTPFGYLYTHDTSSFLLATAIALVAPLVFSKIGKPVQW